MNLSAEQWKFFQNINRLKSFAIGYAVQNGYIINAKERLRTALQAWANGLPAHSTITANPGLTSENHFWEEVGGVGKTQSVHLSALADDWILLKDGKDVTSIETMRPLGEYWKSLDTANRWGGDFIHPKPDPYHFEQIAT